MTFYIGPAGAPLPGNPADAEGWTEVGHIETGTLIVDIAPDTEGFVAAIERVCYTANLRFKGKHMELAAILGVSYRHPRQILHNGRKPR